MITPRVFAASTTGTSLTNSPRTPEMSSPRSGRLYPPGNEDTPEVRNVIIQIPHFISVENCCCSLQP